MADEPGADERLLDLLDKAISQYRPGSSIWDESSVLTPEKIRKALEPPPPEPFVYIFHPDDYAYYKSQGWI